MLNCSGQVLIKLFFPSAGLKKFKSWFRARLKALLWLSLSLTHTGNSAGVFIREPRDAAGMTTVIEEHYRHRLQISGRPYK